ncbi:hypothetical protein SAMN05428969_1141 [Devosia sp. YR412]|uniref:hypothetical protein n=1 Tax=Devosia sp. YR412 TaxID=1881030 RepID=UPI0008C8EFF2|nr:hypothetical protein [Devosia sp. YR412]SEP83916.1 hypothetical protein SAMN05428969_1141 [Devosia sp. YR412]
MISRTGIFFATLALLVTPALADPFEHSSGEWREYHRDWLASCPDAIHEDATDYYGFSCFASTGSQELNSANLPAYKLTLMRNRLTGDLDLAITVAADNVEADTSRKIILAFGGAAPVSLDFTTDLETRYNTINQFYVVDPALKAELIERLKARNAVSVTLPLTGPKTNQTVWFSLRGVAASLDFMATYARRVAQY